MVDSIESSGARPPGKALLKNEMSKLRVLIADAHPLVRQSLRRYLEFSGFEVVGEAATALEAVETTARLKPDVAIVDMHLSPSAGAQLAACLKRETNTLRVLMLTLYDNPVYVSAAIEAGADACVLKMAPLADLCRTVDALVPHGDTAYSRPLA